MDCFFFFTCDSTGTDGPCGVRRRREAGPKSDNIFWIFMLKLGGHRFSSNINYLMEAVPALVVVRAGGGEGR